MIGKEIAAALNKDKKMNKVKVEGSEKKQASTLI